MKLIAAVIEKAEDGGYGVYAKDVHGLTGYGLTEEEAKNDFLEVILEQAEFYSSRRNEYPEWYDDGNYKVEYRYDMSGFFMSFPFINATEFAKSVGINPSLMRKYKNGMSVAREKQKTIIQEKFNEIVAKMENVRF